MRTLVKKVPEFPFSTEAKSDIRDVLTHYKDGTRAWSYLASRLVDFDLEDFEEEVEAETCESFEDLNNCFRENLFWTDKASDALAACLAVTVSLRIKGPLLWAYLIGPSGCGKSTICESISADKARVKRLNSFTGLHSGYKTGDPNNPDASLANKLLGKALVVPDFTSILALSASMQEKIYGELRNAYDGTSSVHYGNDTEREYTKLTFPLLAGVTHEIHTLKKSALGERFLKIDMTDIDSMDQIVQRNIANVAKSVATSMEDNSTFDEVDEQNPFMRTLKAKTHGFLDHLFQKIADGYKIDTPEWFLRKVAAMGIIVAASRGEVKRQNGPDRELTHRPVIEVGSHVAGQLTKLGMAIALVLDRQPDEVVLSKLRRVALDTAYGFQLEIIRVLGDCPEGLTPEQVARKVRLTVTSTRRALEDLRELGVVCRVAGEVADGESHVVYLADRYQNSWEELMSVPVEAPESILTASNPE